MDLTSRSKAEENNDWTPLSSEVNNFTGPYRSPPDVITSSYCYTRGKGQKRRIETERSVKLKIANRTTFQMQQFLEKIKIRFAGQSKSMISIAPMVTVHVQKSFVKYIAKIAWKAVPAI